MAALNQLLASLLQQSAGPQLQLHGGQQLVAGQPQFIDCPLTEARNKFLYEADKFMANGRPVEKHLSRSFKTFGGHISKRPISRKLKVHAYSIIIGLPVAPMLRWTEETVDRAGWVWFEQDPSQTLSDLGLINCTHTALLHHLTELRRRRVKQCGDNLGGVDDHFNNIWTVALRYGYNVEWDSGVVPKAKAFATATATASLQLTDMPRLMPIMDGPPPLMPITDASPTAPLHLMGRLAGPQSSRLEIADGGRLFVESPEASTTPAGSPTTQAGEVDDDDVMPLVEPLPPPAAPHGAFITPKAFIQSFGRLIWGCLGVGFARCLELRPTSSRTSIN